MKGTMTHIEELDALNRAATKDAPLGWGVPGSEACQHWGARHWTQWNYSTNKWSRAMQRMVEGLALYADAHAFKYESPIGEDFDLGDEWANAVYAVRGLLNGELGGLDGGTLNKMLYGMLQREGFEK